MKKLDLYIIKKFLGTFFFSIALIISIAMVFDFSEKIDDFIERSAPWDAIIFDYYLNFIPYFANLFSPLFIFISVIFFTSKLASNTEIISILASGISFRRMLLPYFISASILALISFYFNNFLIPDANKSRLEFTNTYVKNPYRNTEKNIHVQLDRESYMYMESYNAFDDLAYKFSLEKFDEDGQLTYKLIADYVKWDSVKNKWSIQNYFERYIDGLNEKVKTGMVKDTSLNILPKDFKTRKSEVESLDYNELNAAIAEQKFKGSKMAVFYEIEKHKRMAFPFASFILTLMGVSIASRKVRGGIGLHIGAGIGLSFTYILFMQISQTFATNGSLSPAFAAWIPNIIYGIIALYLLKKAPK